LEAWILGSGSVFNLFILYQSNILHELALDAQYEKSKAIIEKLLEENARLKERTTFDSDRSARGKTPEAQKIGIFCQQAQLL